MAGKELTIGGETFRTKEAAVARVRGILYGAVEGEALPSQDFAFVLDLLLRHPRANEKIGCGVRDIRVETNRTWRAQRYFRLCRVDGTSTDFSFLKCIRRHSATSDFKSACRAAIREQILAFKSAFFREHRDGCDTVRCAISGAEVGFYDAHVDHEPPWTFDAIVASFIPEHGLVLSQVRFLRDSFGVQFADPTLKEAFGAFHRQRAQLRVVSAHANLTQKRGSRGR